MLEEVTLKPIVLVLHLVLFLIIQVRINCCLPDLIAKHFCPISIFLGAMFEMFCLTFLGGIKSFLNKGVHSVVSLLLFVST